MSLIQIILVLASLGALVFYFAYFRSLLRDRLIALAICATAVFAIFFPEFTTIVANFLGVGRGADLLIYVLAMGGVFALLILSTRLSDTQRTVTELIRQLAIINAKEPERTKHSK
jgi:hypothetical protein